MRMRTVPREGCNLDGVTSMTSHWKGGLHRRNCSAPDSYHRAACKVQGLDEVRLIAAVARPRAIAVVLLEQRYVMAAADEFEHDDITGLRRAHAGRSPVQPCRRP